MSLIELEVAEKVTNCARVVLAMIRASVVLPEPGGPQKIIDGMRSVSIALRRKRPGASSSLRPTTSSSVLGRTRSGSGASFGVLGSGGVVSNRVMGETKLCGRCAPGQAESLGVRQALSLSALAGAHQQSRLKSML